MVYTDASGKPQGFAVDVLNEAARREGITLEWQEGAGARNNNQSLLQGDVDLIPAGIETPERRRLFFVSEPWWSSHFVALVPAGSPVRFESDLDGRRLSVPETAAPVIGQFYSHSRLVLRHNAVAAAEAACTGGADAALVAGMYIRELLLAGSSACQGISLRTVDSAARLDYVLVARFAVAKEVQALRKRLEEITADGTLATLAARHPPISTPTALRLEELVRLRYERRVWRTGVTGAIAVLLLAGVFIAWQYRSRQWLRGANAQLEAANHDKSVLLREVQHRVKNNLQVISSLVSLQAASADDDRVRAALTDTQERIRSIALIHEKLCFSGAAAEIDFIEYARDLGTHLMQSYSLDPDRIRLHVEGDATLPLDEAAPCGLIANELLSNVFKHAFVKTRGGDVWLLMRSDNGEFAMEVKDNGPGLPPGFEIEQSLSLGLKVVSDLAEQLHGRLEYSSNGGASFRLRIPVRSCAAEAVR